MLPVPERLDLMAGFSTKEHSPEKLDLMAGFSTKEHS